MDGCGDMNVPLRKFIHRHMIEGLLIRACRLIETVSGPPACMCAALVLSMFGHCYLVVDTGKSVFGFSIRAIDLVPTIHLAAKKNAERSFMIPRPFPRKHDFGRVFIGLTSNSTSNGKERKQLPYRPYQNGKTCYNPRAQYC